MGGEGLAVGAGTLDSFAGLGIGALGNGAFRRGHQVDHVVQQLGDTHAAGGGAADHGHDGAVQYALAQAGHDLVLGQLLALEVLHHQLVVGAGGRFDQGFVALFYLSLDGGGDVHGLQVLALAHERLLLQQAGNAGELATLDDGHLDGSQMAAVLLGQGVQNLVEVCVFLIHLGDDDHPGGVGLVADGPGLFRAHVQAGNRANDDQGAFAHIQRPHLLAGEIEVAGNIHQVHLAVLPLQRRH